MRDAVLIVCGYLAGAYWCAFVLRRWPAASVWNVAPLLAAGALLLVWLV